MEENKILVSDIVEKIKNGINIKDIKEIEIKKYLKIGIKKIIIEEIIKDCIKEVDGMKIVNSISKHIALKLSLINFYTNIKGDFDEMCEYGIIDYIEKEISDEYFILCDFVDTIIEQELNNFNSVSGVLNRNLKKLIDKLPSNNDLIKLLKELPKQLNKLNPDKLEYVNNLVKTIENNKV